MTESRTYAQRHKLAVDHFAQLHASGDGEVGVAEFRETLGAFGDMVAPYLGADIWARPGLVRRDRCLIIIAMLASLGLTSAVTAFSRMGLRDGLTRAEIEEALIQVGGYAGMPFGNLALRAAAQHFDTLPDTDPREPAAQKSDGQRRADAVDVLRTLTDGRAASDPEQARAGMVETLGGVGELAYDFAFGELWSRDELSRRDRSLVVVVILAVLSKEQELVFHVPAALNHGVTRDEIEEVMVTLAGYGGFPRAVEGMRAARSAFARIDERESS